MAATHELSGDGTGAHADDDPLLRGPWVHRFVTGDDTFQTVVHLLRSLAQGQLTEGDQVTSLEEVGQCAGDLVEVVHDATLQAVEQGVGGQVDEYDLVGFIEHRVG